MFGCFQVTRRVTSYVGLEIQSHTVVQKVHATSQNRQQSPAHRAYTQPLSYRLHGSRMRFDGANPIT